MSGFGTGLRYVRRARKRCRCDYCGQWIFCREPKLTWTYFDGGKGVTMNEHVECHLATGFDVCFQPNLDENSPYVCWSHRRGEVCGETTMNPEDKIKLAVRTSRALRGEDEWLNQCSRR